ncbi:phosphopantetheinyl transferase protein [Rutstroemia sp. NJR-2017a WRK4]|nr:phosphopantetheinyl transferase protein [Rutstroemia sp. NJR-2017a WRK4]
MATAEREPFLVQWLVDTRPLWPIRGKDKPREEVAELRTVASQVLSLLSKSEQEAVLKYYHIRDAKMSLASQLLKHLVITKYCKVPWSKSTITRAANGKPCYIPTEGQPHIEFNVSHQAGLVTLIAVIGGDGKTNVGTDIVCANERFSNDYKYIEKNGFFDWVDMHGDVFAESEIEFMKRSVVGLEKILPGRIICETGNEALSQCQSRNRQVDVTVLNDDNGTAELKVNSNVAIDAKIRRFYAMWCLREAYVKMTGEALLAPWLKDLQICDVRPPSAAASDDPASLTVGEMSSNYRIIFKGKAVTDVSMELTALGSHYMIGGALRTESKVGLALGSWEQIDLEKDVLELGEAVNE